MCVVQRKELDLLGPFFNVILILLLRDIMILILLLRDIMIQILFLIDIMILMWEEFPGSSEYEQLHSQPDPSDCDHLCKHPCHILLWEWEVYTIFCVCGVFASTTYFCETWCDKYHFYQTITSWWNKKNISLFGVFCWKKLYHINICNVSLDFSMVYSIVWRKKDLYYFVIIVLRIYLLIIIIFDQISHWWTRWHGTKRSFLAWWLPLEMWWRRWESQVSKEHLAVST